MGNHMKLNQHKKNTQRPWKLEKVKTKLKQTNKKNKKNKTQARTSKLLGAEPTLK